MNNIKKIPQEQINDLMRGTFNYINGIKRMADEGEISGFDFEKYKNQYLETVRQEDVPKMKKDFEKIREQIQRER